jgi:hypothetical protein
VLVLPGSSAGTFFLLDADGRRRWPGIEVADRATFEAALWRHGCRVLHGPAGPLATLPTNAVQIAVIAGLSVGFMLVIFLLVFVVRI